MSTTSTTQDRTLYGCPSWCSFDHAGQTYVDPGDHLRVLAELTAAQHVGLYISPGLPPQGEGLPRRRRGLPRHSRDRRARLRDVAGMLRQAADELSGLDAPRSAAQFATKHER